MSQPSDLAGPQARTSSCASNARKGALYVERAKLILQEIQSAGLSHPGVVNKVVSRSYLRAKIGCGSAVLSQNRQIGMLVNATDLSLRSQASSSGDLSRRVASILSESLEHSVVQIGKAFAPLVATTDEFTFAGRNWPDVPTMIFSEGIFIPASRWLRKLALADRMSRLTVHQYAKTLRPFIQSQRKSGVAWQDVSDAELIRWRELLVGSARSRPAGEARANYALTVIFQFYLFCEQTGMVRYRVGAYERHSLPESLQAVAFPISAVATTSGWMTNLLFRTVRQSVGNRSTPTDDELEDAHREALRGRNGVRDTTLMRLAEDTGGRRSELLQIKISQLPSLQQIDDLSEDPNGWWPISVRRKGGRTEILRLQPDTLFAIQAYLDVRRGVVDRALRSTSSYSEPDALFLSSTTGKPLQADSVTKLVGTYFRKIGLQAANIHRIRAKFAIDTVETILDGFLEAGITFAPGSNWIETVLEQVAQRMGHRHPSSLRHYLNAALSRRIRTGEIAAERMAKTADRNARTILEAAVQRSKVCSRLLAELTKPHSPAAQASALRQFADELESLDDRGCCP